MLNPCKAKIWFVVELCEPIQPSSIELANFELYSSTPKEIQIQGSDKYPSQEWLQLGSFAASESRELQRFDIKSQSNYMKFIRIDLHSYYGSEHFCPVSLIRAFGISLAEEFDTMENGATAAAAAAAAATSASSSANTEPPVQNPPPDQVLSNESVNEMGSGTMTSTDVPLSELTNKASGPDELVDIDFMKQVHGCSGSDILLLGDKEENSCHASRESLAKAPAPSPSPTVHEAAPIENNLSPTPVLVEVAEINSRITSTAPVADIAVPAAELTPLSGSMEVTMSPDVSASGATSADSTPTEHPTATAVVAPTPPETTASLQPQPSEPLTVTPAAAPVTSPLPPVLQGPAHVMNESSTGSVIAASSSKESIFIRLNNRIKALELNMSLNREAIESLAKKQDMFEYRMSEMINRTKWKEDEGQRLIYDLQIKLNDISEQVYLLVSEKEVFHWQLIQVHILLMVIEIAIIIMIMSSYMKKMIASAAATAALPCQQQPLTHSLSLTPSRPVFKFRSTPEKSSLLVDHHPITGTALFKKKRKKKKKNKGSGLPAGDQENVPPPPSASLLQHPHHHDPQPQQQQLSQINGKIAGSG